VGGVGKRGLVLVERKRRGKLFLGKGGERDGENAPERNSHRSDQRGRGREGRPG